MPAVRLRHPNGVSTLQVAFDRDGFTVLDLQQEIHTATDILPSRQILKTGYPPRALTIVPELPLASLGLKSGEQIIVSESTESPTYTPSQAPPARATVPSSPSRTTSTRSSTLSSIGTSNRAAAAPAPQQPTTNSSGPDYVEVEGGVLVHRIVPDDNSCLFSSVALVFEQKISKAFQMRKIVVEGIQKDPETFNEAILGMAPSQYIATILKPTSWGGAIELTVLAAHYRAEIASIDVETGRIDRFTPRDAGTGMRCILIYSGIHYDAASLAPMADAPVEWHQTLFPVESNDSDADPTLVAAKKLAAILRSKKAFTNTATFDLKCEQCGQGLKGEKGARAHAEQTGHTNFGEY